MNEKQQTEKKTVSNHTNATSTSQNRADNIVDHILNLPPSIEFFEKTQNIDSVTLSLVVKQLRLQAQNPFLTHSANPDFSKIPVVDVCGTGGSGGFKLNTSTLLALMLPEFGFSVVKHSGRSASGKTGSLDLLEHLGLSFDVLFDNAAELSRAFGLVYLAAGKTYSSFARYASTRKAYGKPTVFNLLGPLLNPVPLSNRILGAYSPEVARLLAQTLKELNEPGLLVCSEDSEGFLDEASPYGTTHCWKHNPETGLSEISLSPLLKNVERSKLFPDGLNAAKSFLANDNSLACVSAKQLIGFNLALFLSSYAKEFKDHEFNNTLSNYYNHILDSFPRYLNGAQRRLQSIASFVPIHLESPTRIYPSHLESLDETRKDSERINALPATNSDLLPKNLKWTLRGPLIAEIKLKTPLTSFSSSISLEQRVLLYNQHADVISVVTHPKFEGSLDLLRQVFRIAKLPILAKDFVMSKDHILCLKQAGASYILLLHDMLGDSVTLDFAHYCISIGIVPWIETSWDPFVLKVPLTSVLVFNSRNLFSLKESVDYRNRIVFSQKLPSNSETIKNPLVLASGAKTATDVRILRASGCGIIVGSLFMKQKSLQDLELNLKECSSASPILKACGARSLSCVNAAFAHGFDLIGVNLLSNSKRLASDEFIKTLNTLPEIQKQKLCFLTDSKVSLAIRNELSSFDAWEQSYNFPTLETKHLLMPLNNTHQSHALGSLGLLDGSHPGSGESWEISQASLVQRQMPCLLAGGLNPTNVSERFQLADGQHWRVIGFDVASGIEKSDKQGFDETKLQSFALEAKNTFDQFGEINI